MSNKRLIRKMKENIKTSDLKLAMKTISDQAKAENIRLGHKYLTVEKGYLLQHNPDGSTVRLRPAAYGVKKVSSRRFSLKKD